MQFSRLIRCLLTQTTAQIQLISGHESKKSLEVYQHLSLDTVAEAYHEVMESVGV